MKLYQLIYPSLTWQIFIRPFLPILEALSPTKHHDQKVHKTGLEIVETDDAGMTFRFFDGFFLYGFVLAFLEEEDLITKFTPEGRDTSERDWAWLDELWKRNLIHSGHDRVISKLFSVTPQTPAFLKAKPDAKVLYLARDPVNVIRSRTDTPSACTRRWSSSCDGSPTTGTAAPSITTGSSSCGSTA
jgi:hypothetical protein